MSIQHVILGLLSEQPLTGYDLKKKFSSSTILPWSGNNNQIYKSLVELHDEKLVTVDVQYQESKPPRKLYSITDEGRAALHQWLQSPPELPEFNNELLIKLSWADQLEAPALSAMLEGCEQELEGYIATLTNTPAEVRAITPASPRAALFATRIAEHWISLYELDLHWVRKLREEIAQQQDE